MWMHAVLWLLCGDLMKCQWHINDVSLSEWSDGIGHQLAPACQFFKLTLPLVCQSPAGSLKPTGTINIHTSKRRLFGVCRMSIATWYRSGTGRDLWHWSVLSWRYSTLWWLENSELNYSKKPNCPSFGLILCHCLCLSVCLPASVTRS